MLGRDGYLPGVPCWVDTAQPDPQAAVASTAASLAGSSRTRCLPVPPPITSSLASAAATSPLWVHSRRTGPRIAVWNTYIWVDSADEAAAKVRDAGGRAVTGGRQGSNRSVAR